MSLNVMPDSVPCLAKFRRILGLGMSRPLIHTQSGVFVIRDRVPLFRGYALWIAKRFVAVYLKLDPWHSF